MNPEYWNDGILEYCEYNEIRITNGSCVKEAKLLLPNIPLFQFSTIPFCITIHR